MLYAAIIVGFGVAMPADADPRARGVLERYFDTWSAVQALSYKFRKYERMCDGHIEQALLRVKYKKPGLIYMAAIEPSAGREVIYNPNRSRDELTVHPGSFPDLTLDLDIRGKLTTAGEHHLILDVGFGYSLKVIKSGMDQAAAAPQGEKLLYKGESTLHGRSVDVILLDAGDRPARQEMAKEGETLLAFAARVGFDAYHILCANPELRRVIDELDAKPYVVPGTYGKTTEIAVDRELGLPVRSTTRDAQGKIYEQYDYLDMQVGLPFTERDFDPDNPAYNF